jgi:hypothetical protein
MLFGIIRVARPPPKFEVAPLAVVLRFEADLASAFGAACFLGFDSGFGF